LAGESDQAYLAEVQVEIALEDRINRRQQRLNHVIQKVAEADHGQHCVGGPLPQVLPRRRRLDGTHTSE
jgi:hypothetical protein